MNTSTFIIAEAGVNHNGSLDMAFKLIDAAIHSGADAVKFQAFNADSLVSPSAPKASYQANSSNGRTQHEMLKSLELTYSDLSSLSEYCRHKNIDFIATPFDIDSADLLVDLGVTKLKVSSGDLTNYQLLAHLKHTSLPLYISTGMADISEINEALTFLSLNASSDPLPTLFHCTSTYPAPAADLNLACIKTLINTFDLPVGYSDHSTSIIVPSLAISLGATVIEKHITLDNDLQGPDHHASLNPSGFAQMVHNLRHAEQAIGSAIKQPTRAEEQMKFFARRSIYLLNDLKAGHPIQAKDLTMLRPGDGISPTAYLDVLGKIPRHDLPKGHKLSFGDFIDS